MVRRHAKPVEKVAEDGMPGWKAIDAKPLSDTATSVDSDFAGVSLSQLHAKFGGKVEATSDNKSARRSRGLSAQATGGDGDTHLVRMRNTTGSDNALGDKVAVVSNGKLIGVQG